MAVCDTILPPDWRPRDSISIWIYIQSDAPRLKLPANVPRLAQSVSNRRCYADLLETSVQIVRFIPRN
jgi:hypothetical protein